MLQTQGAVAFGGRGSKSLFIVGSIPNRRASALPIPRCVTACWAPPSINYGKRTPPACKVKSPIYLGPSCKPGIRCNHRWRTIHLRAGPRVAKLLAPARARLQGGVIRPWESLAWRPSLKGTNQSFPWLRATCAAKVEWSAK